MRGWPLLLVLALGAVAHAAQLDALDPLSPPICRPAADTFPARSSDAPSGTEFGAQVVGLTDRERYQAARDQVLSGNVPQFLRKLVPVTLRRPAGMTEGAHEVIVFVTPDYLSVGDDRDHLTIPLDFVTAAEVARDLGFALPTSRIVDAVYASAALRLTPVPLPAGPEMRSIGYILEHRARVEAERVGQPLGPLVAGNQKDVVLTGRLRSAPDKEAIYGWHKQDGRPIQPLCLVHGATYADYSHGIRLVDATVIVDGVPRPYLDALGDPSVAPLLSGEGPIPDAASLMRPGSSHSG